MDCGEKKQNKFTLLLAGVVILGMVLICDTTNLDLSFDLTDLVALLFLSKQQE